MELRVIEVWFRGKPKNGTGKARLPLILLGLCLIVSPVVAACFHACFSTSVYVLTAMHGQFFNNAWREYRGKFTVEF